MRTVLKSSAALAVIACAFFLLPAGCARRDPARNSETDEPWLYVSQELNPSNIPAGRTVILVHGFLGSPFDLKPLAVKLAETGFRVVVPALPGQMIESYSSETPVYTPDFYTNWLEEIVERETKKSGKKPYLVGFSMGGTISTIVASGDSVDKLVLLSPFYSLVYANDFVWAISRAVSGIIPRLPKLKKGFINYSEGYKRYRSDTHIVSLAVYDTLERLALIAGRHAAKISVPILIIGSRNDQVASFARTKQMFMSNAYATILEYPRSDHILLYDYDSESIVSNVVAFLRNGVME